MYKIHGKGLAVEIIIGGGIPRSTERVTVSTQMESQETLLTTSEVALRLGVATRTICLWAEVGELPGIKIGRQWRFVENDLSKWLAKLKEASLGGLSVQQRQRLESQR